MQIAIGASETVRGSTSPNPPVGAVILDRDGRIAGVGATQPPGGPHAEIVALEAAGRAARGGTAVVTLEPCDHQGRTGPCSRALVDAGIAEVHFAAADPNPRAAGGAGTLAEAGVFVSRGVRERDVETGPLQAWLHRERTGRPLVRWKYAASLDGRSAAADGTSQWITGPAARAVVHAQRATLDAIVVGTGTVIADDPWLTARTPEGDLAAHQPVRIVVGLRDIPEGARVLDDAAPTVLVRTHDPAEIAAALADYTDVLVEGGPRLAGAFLAAGLVDRIEAYIAPIVLGDGPAAAVSAGVTTLAHAHRFRFESAESAGPDVLLHYVRDEATDSATPAGGRDQQTSEGT
ncbi:bifunctional diaminohydroxyphosphoribosylaminopyrimidine deaminase/5-amino-6-(5-phosphoribosylamino)uracil reductase RibD [Rhodococcus rhodnii]|nr:bifunctional diaminohydroxyphosphoribosylaminopyrimidine deaminase/5-amino-6-(5-phosphoribosylamino)uracil reductase RibD [Rhodococcus rhodnii]TXG92692.1 bifunctional diaminohydroxyphosphoribosylaminopyrimidine deaminase/5-amino-6-(5-phosphoribosylamino)uracil reductase RibD [Rhodococcus rhodnii]